MSNESTLTKLKMMNETPPSLNDASRNMLEKVRGKKALDRRVWFVSFVMAVVYAAFIFNRNFISVTADAIRDDPDLNIDTEDIADLAVIAGISFGIGKVLDGVLVDRFNAKYCLWFFMVLSAAMVICFSYATNQTTMAWLVIPNAVAQAGGYPALAKMTYEWFNPNQYGRVFMFISLGSRIGSFSSAIILGAFLESVTKRWDHTVRIAPIMFGVAFLLAVPFLRSEFVADQYEEYVDSRKEATRTPKDEPFDFRKLLLKFKRILSNRRFWLVSMGSACLLMSKSFEGFISLYVGDVLQTSSGTAGMLSGLVPAGLVTSLLVGGLLFEKMPMERRFFWTLMMCLVNIAAAIAILIFTWHVETKGFGDSYSLYVVICAVLLFILGFGVGYPFYIPQSVFAARFGGEDTATVNGWAECVQAAWISIFVKLGGNTGQNHGWRYVVLMVVGGSIAAFFLMSMFFYYELQHENKEAVFFEKLLDQGKDIFRAAGGQDKREILDKGEENPPAERVELAIKS